MSKYIIPKLLFVMIFVFIQAGSLKADFKDESIDYLDCMRLVGQGYSLIVYLDENSTEKDGGYIIKEAKRVEELAKKKLAEYHKLRDANDPVWPMIMQYVSTLAIELKALSEGIVITPSVISNVILADIEALNECSPLPDEDALDKAEKAIQTGNQHIFYLDESNRIVLEYIDAIDTFLESYDPEEATVSESGEMSSGSPEGSTDTSYLDSDDGDYDYGSDYESDSGSDSESDEEEYDYGSDVE